jgi:hypothetical protein
MQPSWPFVLKCIHSTALANQCEEVRFDGSIQFALGNPYEMHAMADTKANGLYGIRTPAPKH